MKKKNCEPLIKRVLYFCDCFKYIKNHVVFSFTFASFFLFYSALWVMKLLVTYFLLHTQSRYLSIAGSIPLYSIRQCLSNPIISQCQVFRWMLAKCLPSFHWYNIISNNRIELQSQILPSNRSNRKKKSSAWRFYCLLNRLIEWCGVCDSKLGVSNTFRIIW